MWTSFAKLQFNQQIKIILMSLDQTYSCLALIVICLHCYDVWELDTRFTFILITTNNDYIVSNLWL
jgi:hypothetical protein